VAARSFRTQALAWLRASICVLLLCQCACQDAALRPEVLSYGRFRSLHIYRPAGTPERLALVLSGDRGWTPFIGSLAQELAASGTLVAGVDVEELLQSLGRDPASCVAPGAELAALAHYLQQRYALTRSMPVLIGHSAGATFAYLGLAQSPAGSFAGALTLSFCEDLDLLKPLCRSAAVQYLPRSGGVRLLPAATLPAPWLALHGLNDEECPAPAARSFVAAVAGARFVGLPQVTHSYRRMARWWPQFTAAYSELR
jgi:type IV secretory pathway VirJ component